MKSVENTDTLQSPVCAAGADRPANGSAFKGIIGQCAGMQKIFQVVRKVADSDTTILINGETGTGKGMIARAIHACSRRDPKPFVAINCGAIPEGLLESELFGHVRGAFTGATSAKTGKFELANGGTIFLDEIGDMSADLQVKLLRVLEERQFEPVGGNRTIGVDVRIIAATHRDLEEAVQKGDFREDLFYRLHVIPLLLPSLKERREDIPLLIDQFLDQFSRLQHRPQPVISSEALQLLIRYGWPGNVRELKNLVERLVVLHAGESIAIRDLPPKMNQTLCPITAPQIDISEAGICLNTEVCEFEKALILQSLEKTHWVKNKAAKLLHLNRTTLVEKIKRHDLQKYAVS